MFRLILFVILAVAIVVTGVFVASIVVSAFAVSHIGGRDNMSGPLHKICYVALVILLCGLSLGWIGGL